VNGPTTTGFFSLGEVFRQKAMSRSNLYGGYAYFDNWRRFSRATATRHRPAPRQSDAITFENIWGVADEDLFKLAIASSTSHAARSRSSRTS